MKFRSRTDWPLGTLVFVACVPLIAVLAYLIWSGEVGFWGHSGQSPLLLTWHQNRAALVIFVAIVLVAGRLFQRKQSPESEADETVKHTPETTDF